MLPPLSRIIRRPHEKLDDSERGSIARFLQTAWTTKKIWPEYLHFTLKFPHSFSELVELAKRRNGVVPTWLRIPQIMTCPELSGYDWTYQYCRGSYSDHSLGDDQRLFRRIVLASVRTDRPPLCAPDFFFYDSDDKKRTLKMLFNRRDNIPGIRWNLSLQTKRPQDHVDWPRLVEHIQTQLPTGGFLFSPSEWSMTALGKDEHHKHTAWDTTLFVRSVVEIQGYAETIRVRQEIVDFVTALGRNITLPRTPLTRKWSQDDRKLIVSACNQYWIKWRENAERKLRERG
jgi:hypothetical protein